MNCWIMIITSLALKLGAPSPEAFLSLEQSKSYIYFINKLSYCFNLECDLAQFIIKILSWTTYDSGN